MDGMSVRSHKIKFHRNNTCFLLLSLSVLTLMTLTGTVITSLVHYSSSYASFSLKSRYTNQAFMHIIITIQLLCSVSLSLKQIHINIQEFRALSWSHFSSHQMEKNLFYHHLQRKRVEWSGTKEQKNKPSTELTSEKCNQTYLSCRKTAAPPKQQPSLCLWPGLWAVTGTCQSQEAPYLQRHMRLLMVAIMTNHQKKNFFKYYSKYVNGGHWKLTALVMITANYYK